MTPFPIDLTPQQPTPTSSLQSALSPPLLSPQSPSGPSVAPAVFCLFPGHCRPSQDRVLEVRRCRGHPVPRGTGCRAPPGAALPFDSESITLEARCYTADASLQFWNTGAPGAQTAYAGALAPPPTSHATVGLLFNALCLSFPVCKVGVITVPAWKGSWGARGRFT